MSAAGEIFENTPRALAKFCYPPPPSEIIPPLLAIPPFLVNFFHPPFLEFLKISIPPSKRGGVALWGGGNTNFTEGGHKKIASQAPKRGGGITKIANKKNCH